MFGPSINAHSLYGIFYFCLPISWLLYLLYDSFLRVGWEALFPWLRVEFRAQHWFTIPVSIIIGSSTHVVWDSFTHRYGYAVSQMRALQSIFFTIGTYPVPIYNFLQHGSSLVGGLAVLWGVYDSIKHSESKTFVTSKPTLVALIAVTIFVTFLLCAPFLKRLGTQFLARPEYVAAYIAFRMLAALSIVFVTYAIFVRVRKKN